LVAWEEFIANKKKRADVQIFSKDLLLWIKSQVCGRIFSCK